MPLLTRCPHCLKSLRVPDHAADKKIRCPLCAEVFTAEADIPIAPPVELPETQAVTVTPLPPPLPVVQPVARDPRLPPPRPRERQQRPKKSAAPLILAIVGLVVLLVGGGVTAFLLLRESSPAGGGGGPGGGPGLIAAIPDGDWQPFVNAQGRFEVQLPGKPIEQVIPVNAPGVGVMQARTYVVQHPSGLECSLTYQDLPRPAADLIPPEEHFAIVLKSSLAEVNGQLRQETPLQLGSHPGREWVIDVPHINNTVLVLRYYRVRTGGVIRVFSLNIAARGGPPAEAQKKFFDSFRLTGMPSRSLSAQPLNDTVLGITSDGKTLVSQDGNLRLRAWDVERATQHLLPQPQGDTHDQKVLLTPDGQRLLIARRNGSLSARGLGPNDRETALVPPPKQGFARLALACSGDGKTAFFTTGDVNSHLIGLPGLQRRPGPEGSTRAAALSHDGKLLAALSDRYIHLIETDRNEEVGVVDLGPIDPNQPAALAFSPDGKQFALLCQGRLWLWDVASRAERFRHEGLGQLQAFAFAPDGKRLAAAEPQRVHVWDLATGNEVLHLAPEPGVGANYRGLLFTPDGSQLVVGSGSAIEFWDLAKIPPPPAPQSLRTVPPPAAQARDRFENLDIDPLAVHLAADGKSLAAFGADRAVRRWDLPSGRIANATRWGWQHGHPNTAVFAPDGRTVYFEREQQVLAVEWKSGKQTVFAKGPDYRTSALALSADGKVLATGHFNGWVRAWDTSKGTALAQAPRHRDRVTAIALSPDGKTLASATPEQVPTIRLTDVATGNETALIELEQEKRPQAVAGLAFSPDGKTLACTHGWVVSLIDVTERMVVARSNTARTLGRLKFSPKGERLAAAAENGSVWVWETASGRGKIVSLVPPAGDARELAFAADGERLALALPRQVQVLHLARVLAGRPEAMELVRVKPAALAFDAQGRGTLRGLPRPAVYVGFRDGGKRLVAAAEEGTVRVWEVPGGRSRDVIPTEDGSPVPDVAVAADGSLILGRMRLPLHWIDLKARSTRPLLQTKEQGFGPYGPLAAVAVAPDGKTVATGHFNGFRIWGADGAERHTPEGKGKIAPIALRFTPDGKTLAVGTRDGRLRLWDPDSGKELPMPLPQRAKFGGFRGVNSLDVSPDGALLLAAWDDGVAQVFRMADRTLLHELKTGARSVRSGAFAPDGKRVALGRADGKVELFDADGKSVAVLATNHNNAVRTLAFSPDGALLAAGVMVSNDVELWDLSLALKGGKQ